MPAASSFAVLLRGRGNIQCSMPTQILVVEDDSSPRLAVTDNLEDEGYVVVATASLAAARTAVNAQAFDVAWWSTRIRSTISSARSRKS